MKTTEDALAALEAESSDSDSIATAGDYAYYSIEGDTYTYYKELTVTYGDEELTKGEDYIVSYASGRKNAGTYTVTVKGINEYTGTVEKEFTINKASQTLTVKKATKTVKYSNVKKAKQTVKAITKVSGAKGTVSYKKISGSSKLSVDSKTGKI